MRRDMVLVLDKMVRWFPRYRILLVSNKAAPAVTMGPATGGCTQLGLQNRTMTKSADSPGFGGAGLIGNSAPRTVINARIPRARSDRVIGD